MILLPLDKRLNSHLRCWARHRSQPVRARLCRCFRLRGSLAPASPEPAAADVPDITIIFVLVKTTHWESVGNLVYLL